MNVSTALPGGTAGRYAIYEEIGSGGMATVHLARRLGPVSFSRTVAIKRLHAHLARDPELVAMFLDEARVAARIRHPNVVPTLDVVTERGQPFLVMEYVQGESLARLLASLRQRGERISPSIACSIVAGMLHGLHAAHEATNERGGSLGIVHRDVSPQNVMVGLDGITRVLDFGVAKAAGRLQTTREGQIKGKLAYTAPELVRGGRPTRAADIYSTAVVFWEMLTGEHLFAGDNEASVLERVLFAQVPPPSKHAAGLSTSLDALVVRALERDPARRFATANEMARAVEAVMPIASAPDVGDWVEALAGEALAERAQMMARIQEGDLPTSGTVVADVREATRTAANMRAFALVAIGLTIVAGAVFGLLHGTRALRPTRSALPPPASVPVVASMQPSVPPSLSPSLSPSNSSVIPPTISADDLPAVTSNPRRSPPAAAAPASASRARPGGIANSPPKASHEAAGVSEDGRPQARPGCEPPWRIDTNGIKQYKLECL